ncbi:hypothetical protein HK096_006998 [Nowakowskiella sp. JEL0078]|nr:hypothetical protein HK096_006998 [Nowakowskiella sp. JEL0078]
MLQADYFVPYSTLEFATCVSFEAFPMSFDQSLENYSIDNNNAQQSLNSTNKNHYFYPSQSFSTVKPRDSSQLSVGISIDNKNRKNASTRVSDTKPCTKDTQPSHLSEQFRNLNSSYDIKEIDLIPKSNVKTTLQINTRNLHSENSRLSSMGSVTSNLNSTFCQNQFLLANTQNSPRTPSLISPGNLTPLSTTSEFSLSPLHTQQSFQFTSESIASNRKLDIPRQTEHGFSQELSKPFRAHQLKAEFLRCYIIDDLLGEGGFGSVYSGVRRFDGEEVAVKFIYKHKIPSNLLIQDGAGIVPMEIYILRRIHHDNIIKYLDFFEDSVFFYLVTELHGAPWSGLSPSEAQTAVSHSLPTPSLLKPPVKGLRRRSSCDLFECIEHYSRFTESQSRRVFGQIVNAIAYLHSIGIVHRDIKDENLLIDENFNVKLIDFGSVGLIPQGGKLFDRFLGTLQYASPEILRGEKYKGPEAEIWALGCCLYIMLTGEVPFDHFDQQVCGRYNKPKCFLSRDCQSLIDAMLKVDIQERATIQDILKHSWLVEPTQKQALKIRPHV